VLLPLSFCRTSKVSHRSTHSLATVITAREYASKGSSSELKHTFDASSFCPSVLSPAIKSVSSVMLTLLPNTNSKPHKPRIGSTISFVRTHMCAVHLRLSARPFLQNNQAQADADRHYFRAA
jgi:hypothetical protein